MLQSLTRCPYMSRAVFTSCRSQLLDFFLFHARISDSPPPPPLFFFLRLRADRCMEARFRSLRNSPLKDSASFGGFPCTDRCARWPRVRSAGARHFGQCFHVMRLALFLPFHSALSFWCFNRRTLVLHDVQLENLDFLSSFPLLETLRIFNASRLVDFSGLQSVASSLTDLELVDTGFSSLDSLCGLKELQQLKIAGPALNMVQTQCLLQMAKLVNLSLSTDSEVPVDLLPLPGSLLNLQLNSSTPLHLSDTFLPTGLQRLWVSAPRVTFAPDALKQPSALLVVHLSQLNSTTNMTSLPAGGLYAYPATYDGQEGTGTRQISLAGPGSSGCLSEPGLPTSAFVQNCSSQVCFVKCLPGFSMMGHASTVVLRCSPFGTWLGVADVLCQPLKETGPILRGMRKERKQQGVWSRGARQQKAAAAAAAGRKKKHDEEEKGFAIYAVLSSFFLHLQCF
jgi:hypothetical protein